MAKNKLDRGFSNFGFSTILVAFVMICIVTFSALSLLTANSDYRLSKKVAEKTTAYYKAESKAYRTLSEIDSVLASTYRSTSDKTLYMSRANTRLKEFKAAHTNLSLSVDASGVITYSIPVTDTQTLQVSLQLCNPSESEGHFYELTGWQTKTTVPQQEEEPLHLFGT